MELPPLGKGARVGRQGFQDWKWKIGGVAKDVCNIEGENAIEQVGAEIGSIDPDGS